MFLLRPVTVATWLVTLLALAGASYYIGSRVANSAIDAHDAKVAATRQQEGRAIAIDVLCGFGNGVASAGRNVIRGHRANGQPIPGVHFSRREQKVRDAAAADYGGFIVQTVQGQAGVRSHDVVKADGTLDCAKLRLAARATHP